MMMAVMKLPIENLSEHYSAIKCEISSNTFGIQK